MDTKELQTFVTLAKTLNYQKAAAQLNFAPSTIFNHIQLLEQELNVTLIGKKGRQLELTEEGQRFIAVAQRILAEYTEVLSTFSSTESIMGNVTLGGCEVNTGYNLVRLLISYAEHNPEVRLNMVAASNASIPELVKTGAIDIGFYFALLEQDLPGFETVYLYQEPVVLAAAVNHPLATRQYVNYNDLTDCDFAFPHDDCLFVLEMLDRFKRNKVRIGKTSYLGGVQLVIEQVLKGNAIALMPLSAARRLCDSDGMVILNLDEKPLWVWETILYKNKDALKPAARNLLRYCLRYAQACLNTASPLEMRAPLQKQH